MDVWSIRELAIRWSGTTPIDGHNHGGLLAFPGVDSGSIFEAFPRRKSEERGRTRRRPRHRRQFSNSRRRFFSPHQPSLFMEEFCFRDYHPEYSLSGMISVGYFCFETTVLCIVLRDFSGRALQKIAHHVAGFIAVSTALVCGLNFPLLSQVARCSELSGIFIIIHEQKTKHTKGFADKLNRIIIFATYTFTRIFMFPIIWVHIVYIGYISFNYSRLSWRICYIALTVMATGLVYLNFFWYQFLLRGIKGVCAGVGKKETAKDS